MTAPRPLLLPADQTYGNTVPHGLNQLARAAWFAYERFAPHVRQKIRSGGAGSPLVSAAFRAYGRPMRPRDQRRAFNELMRQHDLRGGGVL